MVYLAPLGIYDPYVARFAQGRRCLKARYRTGIQPDVCEGFSMPMEIERKFLVNGDAWRRRACDGIFYRQGYFTDAGTASVRVLP